MNKFYAEITIERVYKIYVKEINWLFKYDWETKKWKYKSYFFFI